MNIIRLTKRWFEDIGGSLQYHVDPLAVETRPGRDNIHTLQRYRDHAKIFTVNERTEFIDVDSGQTLGSAMVKQIKYYPYWDRYIVTFDDVQESD